MLNFAIDLSERFFAAHGQHGVTQSDENGDDAREMREMHDAGTVQPAHGVRAQFHIARVREGWQRGVPQNDGVHAPHDQDHHHNGGGLHDDHGLLAGFRYALDVVPPEIDGDDDGEGSGAQSR